MMYAFIAIILAFIAGWFSAPAALLKQSGDCALETLFIYDEPNKTVITQAHWFSHPGASEFYYQARVTMQEDNKPKKSVLVHRTVNTELNFHTDFFNIHTVKTFRIAGPETSDPVWGRYIDPMAETGYSSRVYLFQTEVGRKMTGYKNIPITTCQRKIADN